MSRDNGRWENLPAPPFRRRALAVAAINGKIYAIGGLKDDGKVSRSVDFYDPGRQCWSRGPDLPGSTRDGFGPPAFGIDGRLCVSGSDGVLRGLNQAGDGWTTAGRLELRV